MLTPILWSVIASITAIIVEASARHIGGYVWWFVPLGLVISYTVVKTVTTSPTFLTAFIFFSTSNLTLRLLVSKFVLHESLSRGLITAVVLLYVANVARYLWK